MIFHSYVNVYRRVRLQPIQLSYTILHINPNHCCPATACAQLVRHALVVHAVHASDHLFVAEILGFYHWSMRFFMDVSWLLERMFPEFC